MHNAFLFVIKCAIKVVINISTLFIDISLIKKNLAYYRSKLKRGQKICFVAKAGCYGYKAEICRFFDDLVDYFAVSSAAELFEVRKFATKPILILDPLYDENTVLSLIDAGAEFTVSNFKSLETLLKADRLAKSEIFVHIAVNTGMNRFGINQKSDLVKIFRIAEKSDKIVIKGIFSHFLEANSRKIAVFQLKKFMGFASLAKKYNTGILTHISASAAAKWCKYGDMVRLGYGLFGDEVNLPIRLESQIIEIQKLSPGETAGYDGVFKADKNCTIAIVGIGYGDGIFRNITKRGSVLVHGSFSRVVAICMDCMMIDVTGIKCRIGDRVTIIGKSKNNQISVCDLAAWCDTIGYEIIVRLSDRIKRVYTGDNKCKLLPGNTEQES